jgi:NitT/TauT family transport system substrate-binding protein
MQLTRRSFVTKVAVGIANLPFMKGLSTAQLRGKLGYMKIVDNTAMFMAVEQGFFTAEGLELEPVPMAGGALIVQGVTSGALQIGMSNVISLYQAHVEGFDLKLVAGGATHVKGPNEDHALIVPQASPLIRPKDLEGKALAVNTLNNIVHLMAMAWIDKNGADFSKVKFVELPFPQMEAALVAGRVDAVSIHEPFATAALEKAATRVLAHPWGDVIPRFLIGGWFASGKWIHKNKEAVQAFVRAINRGIDAVQADPAGARNVMAKWSGLSAELAGRIGFPVFEAGLSEQDLQVTVDLTHKYKLIARPFKAREVISELAPKA